MISARAFDDDLPQELCQVLEHFERTTGLEVCVKRMSAAWTNQGGRELVPPFYRSHRSAFCTRVKRSHESACIKCDIHDLASACAGREHPLIRTCHAGADEVLAPLWREGALIGVAFIGQFRRHADGPTELPYRSAEQCRHIQVLARMLQRYLLDVLARHEGEQHVGLSRSAARIERFMAMNLHRDPGLQDLAAALGLSASRTAQVVREVTGRSFRELKDARRLAAARDLLIGTNAKIAWVAQQVGVHDPNYFCRYFSRKLGMTPTAYRRKYQQAESV